MGFGGGGTPDEFLYIDHEPSTLHLFFIFWENFNNFIAKQNMIHHIRTNPQATPHPP